jgi:hypothetical protein
MFAGNELTASFDVPSKIIVFSEMLSISMSEVSKNFAPLRERGCFVVVKVTDSSSFCTDYRPSRPAIAPDGR